MHKVFLFSGDFATPEEAYVFESTHHGTTTHQASSLTGDPVSTPNEFAMGTKLNTVAIQTILRGVDIQRDTKGMITEACAVAMIIDIAAGHADPIADHGVYRYSGLDKLM